MKKLVSIFLAVALIILQVNTIKVSADTTYQSGDYKYSISNSTAVIIRYTGSGGDVTIPSKIDGYTVTSIGDNAFFWRDSLTSITIPSSVTYIGTNAFNACSRLISIIIPSSVTNIGNSAFQGCDNLTDITIPSSVTSIGDDAFCDCSSLINITIPSSIASISNETFRNCSSLKSITISNGVTNIGNHAFDGCSNLKSITIPNSVTSIGNDAFGVCGNLTAITIPSSVTSIGDGAFNFCSSLTSITIPSSITNIGDGAFEHCIGLTSINVDAYNTAYTSLDGVLYNKLKTTLISYPARKTNSTFVVPSSVTSIGDDAFNWCCGLTGITIPSSVTSIGNYAFDFCSSLTNIIIPSSVTSIGDGAFDFCSSLTSITIPSDITNIDDFAFGDCSSLTSITIPSGVTSIGDYAFWDCSGLTGITIPSSVTSIGKYAFSRCSSLTSIIIPSSVTNIGEFVFDNCSSNLIIYYHNTSIGFTNPWNGYKTVSYNIVSYNGNGNTLGTVPVDNNIYIKGTKATILKNTGSIVRTGYIFAGWNTAADGSGTSYTPGATVSMNGSDITLYAQWTANRIFGVNRFETAAEVSKKGWTTTSEYAIIATGEDYPDALCAAPLAKKYNAPIILTEKNKLSDAAKNELTRLSVKKVFIVGGVGAVSSDVETEISNLGINPTRIAGTDRYETSLKVAKQLGIDKNPPTAINIATGDNFADALSISSIAAMKEEPILLTSKDSINDDIKQYIKDNSSTITASYIIGGTGVISDTVANSLKNPLRLSGKNRYETNTAVLNNFKSDLDISTVYLATGNNFPDALAASALAAETKSPILLVGSSVDDSTKSFVNNNNASIQKITPVGGTGVISDDILKEF